MAIVTSVAKSSDGGADQDATHVSGSPSLLGKLKCLFYLEDDDFFFYLDLNTAVILSGTNKAFRAYCGASLCRRRLSTLRRFVSSVPLFLDALRTHGALLSG